MERSRREQQSQVEPTSTGSEPATQESDGPAASREAVQHFEAEQPNQRATKEHDYGTG